MLHKLCFLLKMATKIMLFVENVTEIMLFVDKNGIFRFAYKCIKILKIN
jgi:hypothetical protein